MTYAAAQRFFDRHVIQHMAETGGAFGPLETYWHIRCFVNEWIDYDMARALLRNLTDRGYCQFRCGLFSDEGQVAGAGYGLTQAGLDYYDQLFPYTA